jgi:hypothetical protein
MTFTKDEIVELLLSSTTKSNDSEPNTLTTSELRRVAGYGYTRAKRILDTAIEMGLLEPAMIYRVNGWGVGGTVKGYRVIKDSN